MIAEMMMNILYILAYCTRTEYRTEHVQYEYVILLVPVLLLLMMAAVRLLARMANDDGPPV